MYDLLLFGVTGFTGKLAAEFLMHAKLKHEGNPVKWGVCGRNEVRIKDCLKVAKSLAGAEALSIDIDSIPIELVTDLVCGEDEAMLSKLKEVVKKTKVVISTVGPFDKYGHDLVRVCIELGVHYADITGETDFVRKMILKYGEEAKRTGATIVHHCGNDCIPWDVSVYELNKYAHDKLDTELEEVNFFNEMHDDASASGGTTASIKYLMFETSKKKREAGSFDPLLVDYTTGEKSSYNTKLLKFKSSTYIEEFDKYAEDWIMGPVMGNCIKRSNVLCQYSDNLTFSDRTLKQSDIIKSVQDSVFKAKFGLGLVLEGALGLPSFGLIPSSGDGPERDTMEQGFLKLHGRATLKNGKTLCSLFTTPNDPGYMDTAKMLVVSGVLLLHNRCAKGGIITPAYAFGSEMTDFLCHTVGMTFKIYQP